MPKAHQRQKKPEFVRSQLLLVVRELLVQDGLDAVTLDAVSRRAGVTKGGLQHHFRSKQALLEALSDELFAEFELRHARALEAEPDGPARHARAYVRTAFDDDNDCNEVEAQRAIALLAMAMPACRERWNARMKALVARDGRDAQTADRLLLCRIAADGFWFAQMLDVHAISPRRKASLQALLLGLCDTAVAPQPA